MQLFEDYLKAHRLLALAVANRACVRYLTVYNALKGNPISPQHAEQIRQAVLIMTGISFTGCFILRHPTPAHELPNISWRIARQQLS
ncbi:hypothetical protein EPA93_34600 [Ktedonosporobacter rubrisoli]|uniref:Uncharacterized protein n=1 Tax=Ktedonosporobacter rubrisoli TaxID=2509675 RepID=A0A4P6JYN7_KTERU|nr:hypothetical protein [Ktedonosporobacter rubrisoli]QBD80824.1 hypothetical protein EPA93_34600 [Ktedonosporobacter rubrisoli]